MQFIFGASRDKNGVEVLVASQYGKENFSYKRNVDYKTFKFSDDSFFINLENFLIKQKPSCEILCVEAKYYRHAVVEMIKLGYKYLPPSEKPKIFRTKSQIF